MKYLAIVPITLSIAAAGPALAQTDQQNGQQARRTDKCRAETGQGGGEQLDGNSLTLGDCDGVLKPPPTGDSEMTAPLPAEGKTPVLKPGEVPVQPPKK